MKFCFYIQNNLVNATELKALLPPLMHRRYALKGQVKKKHLQYFYYYLFRDRRYCTENEHPRVTATITVKKMFIPLADRTSS